MNISILKRTLGFGRRNIWKCNSNFQFPRQNFQPLGNESSPLCRSLDQNGFIINFHIHVKIPFFHVFGLLFKVLGSSAVDPGSIPCSSLLRQKSRAGNCKVLCSKLIKLDILIHFLIEPT